MKIVEVKEPKVLQSLSTDAFLSGEEVSQYQKYIGQYASAYADEEAANAMKDTLAYTVRTYSPKDPQLCKEALNWGVTSMEPVCVNGECNLTRGHFHASLDHAEFYMCVSGEGYLILWDGADEVILETMKPGSLHYIDGRYAHRMVNYGDSQMNVLCCWSVQAGHNYGAIEEKGFPVRIYKENGKVVVKEV